MSYGRMGLSRVRKGLRVPAATLWRRAYGNATLLLCVAVLGWSGNFVVGRLAHSTIPPVALALLRWLLALAVIWPVAWPRMRADRGVLFAHRWTVLALGITGVAVFNTLVYRGLQTTTAVSGLLLQSVCPVLIVLVAAGMHRTRPRLVELAGLAVSLAGVWVVISRGNVTAPVGVGTAIGDLWILLAVASYAVYTVVLRDRPPVHPLSLLGSTFGIGALALIPFALLEAMSGQRVPLTSASLATIAYVGLVPSIVSYFCFNRGVELIGGARAGQFIHLMPVFGAVLSFLVLGEQLAGFHLAGAALIAAGLVISARGPRPASGQPPGTRASRT